MGLERAGATQFHPVACKNNIKCYFFIGARFPLGYVAGLPQI
jgi:hypothetical protein